MKNLEIFLSRFAELGKAELNNALEGMEFRDALEGAINVKQAYKLAQIYDVEGRSKMRKAELVYGVAVAMHGDVAPLLEFFGFDMSNEEQSEEVAAAPLHNEVSEENVELEEVDSFDIRKESDMFHEDNYPAFDTSDEEVQGRHLVIRLRTGSNLELKAENIRIVAEYTEHERNFGEGFDSIIVYERAFFEEDGEKRRGVAVKQYDVTHERFRELYKYAEENGHGWWAYRDLSMHKFRTSPTSGAIARRLLLQEKEEAKDVALTLDRTIEIIVVDTTDDMKNIALDIAKDMANTFGGFNMYEGIGGWVDDEGNLVQEKHMRVSANAMTLEGHSEAIADMVKKASVNQDAVSLVIDGTLHIIDTNGGDLAERDMKNIQNFVSGLVDA